MAHYDFDMPITEAQARALRVQDTVTLNGALFGIRDATQIHLFDRGRKTRETRPVMHRFASARRRATAWSASRGR
jgi:tartrate dehydratase beta subunit/fumarate hydratase class I family protein